MSESIERAYTTKEISLTINIGTSTLRKWCLALEEQGYKFSRTETNKRLFIERDLVALKYFQKLVQGENFSLENAAKVVTSKYEGKASESRTPSVLQSNDEDERSLMRSLESLEKKVNNQNELIKTLVAKMDQQQLYIEERLNKRDEMLLKTLNESMETRRLLAAAQNEKKGFLSRLFKK